MNAEDTKASRLTSLPHGQRYRSVYSALKSSHPLDVKSADGEDGTRKNKELRWKRLRGADLPLTAHDRLLTEGVSAIFLTALVRPAPTN